MAVAWRVRSVQLIRSLPPTCLGLFVLSAFFQLMREGEGRAGILGAHSPIITSASMGQISAPKNGDSLRSCYHHLSLLQFAHVTCVSTQRE